MLRNLEVTNFRTFSHLRVDRFGTVNLVLGKNNVGKTALLEALRFYAMGSATALREYLTEHEELTSSPEHAGAHLDLRSLFHGRPSTESSTEIGPLNSPDQRLKMRLTDIERVEESDGTYHWDELTDPNAVPEGEVFLGVMVQRAGQHERLVSPEVTRRAIRLGKYVGPAFVSARGVLESDLAQWWDAIALTESEERVIDCLSLVAPIERVTTTENPLRAGDRIFKARMRGQDDPVPLRSVGGGTVRMFQIAVAFEYACRITQKRQRSLFPELDYESCQGAGLLLIDEIENGIHYSLHKDLWAFIFRMARERNIQVFATTHSWDCLKGFAQAVKDDEQADGLAIRLEKVEGKPQTGAVILDREDLPIVVRERIEVR